MGNACSRVLACACMLACARVLFVVPCLSWVCIIEQDGSVCPFDDLDHLQGDKPAHGDQGASLVSGVFHQQQVDAHMGTVICSRRKCMRDDLPH